MPIRPAPALAAVLALCSAAAAQPIRNAPPPRALETAAYVFAAANVCGYRIGVEPFETLLGRYNVTVEDVRPPRGPFGAKVQAMFTLMSNQMMANREEACRIVATEFGPEGNVAKGILLPAAAQAPGDGAPAAPAEGAPRIVQ
ncbi:conserved hypothetical protein [Methylobacterium sp. 4-46]|uniref:hypothetical protein n=1 Tax=unclassified Methylobacterium TaxID=2615210 RepID=UPI000152DB2B|nr:MULTISPECIES: hypothetical protein [Methylobacterium]ACA19608.1 conserved hypothetical protein [Methylobacterium sp. 4-46]WFT78802.1 hypothetical protein QA634_26585 [Methylobacterium nodulans]